MKFYVIIDFNKGPSFGTSVNAMCEETAKIVAHSWAKTMGFDCTVKTYKVTKL